MPRDWKVVILNHIAEFDRGFSYHGFEKNKTYGRYVFITLNNVYEGGGFKKSFSYITSDRLKEKNFVFREDIILANTEQTKTGTLLGCPALVDFPVSYENNQAVFSHHITRVIPKPIIYKNYLYYSLWHNQPNAIKYHTGSVIWSLDVKNWSKNEKCLLPPLLEQKQIAKILSDLDSKIELNRRMNQTLEKIAQAVFKSWFVDYEFPDKDGKPYRSSGGEMVWNEELGKEIPKGWNRGKLNELLINIKKPLKTREDWKNRKYVPIDNLSIKKINLENFQDPNNAKSSLIAFEKNDILMGAMRVYFHRVNLAPFAGITRTTTFVLRPRVQKNLEFSLLLLNSNSTIKYATLHSQGTTMPYAIWNNVLSEMDFVFPDAQILEKFSKIVQLPIIKIRDSIFEHDRLMQLRDSLLPKLMSGKIRVKS